MLYAGPKLENAAGTDAFAGGGGSVLSGTATVTVPQGYEHEQAVTAAGVLSTHKIIASLAPALDTDENDPALIDLLTLWGNPAAGQITFGLTFSEPTSGPIKINWVAV